MIKNIKVNLPQLEYFTYILYLSLYLLLHN